jgi:hypothetical protein
MYSSTAGEASNPFHFRCVAGFARKSLGKSGSSVVVVIVASVAMV